MLEGGQVGRGGYGLERARLGLLGWLLVGVALSQHLGGVGQLRRRVQAPVLLLLLEVLVADGVPRLTDRLLLL